MVELPARGVAPANGAIAPEAAAREASDRGKHNDESGASTTPSEASTGSEQSLPRAPAPFHVPNGAWVLGGLGVAGVVSFAALLTRAKNDRADLETCTPDCPVSQTDADFRKLLAADVSLGIGIAALAGAGVWTLSSWLVHRHAVAEPSQSALLSLVPTRGGAFGSIAARY
jgi:hypothetical protein